LTLKNSVKKKTVMNAETERLREALDLILTANSLPYAHEIASKALSEQDASPCPTNTIK
jgi:hypothetical protein